ncbi:MAG: biopolymer transporter ExbD [bacterium]
MKRFPGFRGHDEGINLTPLLDVMFNLLFFFVLATTLKEQEHFMPVELPRAQQSEVAEGLSKALIITVTKEEELVFDGKVVTGDELVKRLKESAEGEGQTVVIRADGRAETQATIEALDACARAGKFSIRVEVQKKTE